jgi:hypothetical protein
MSSPFDSEVTVWYKYARYWMLPPQLIVRQASPFGGATAVPIPGSGTLYLTAYTSLLESGLSQIRALAPSFLTATPQLAGLGISSPVEVGRLPALFREIDDQLGGTAEHPVLEQEDLWMGSVLLWQNLVQPQRWQEAFTTRQVDGAVFPASLVQWIDTLYAGWRTPYGSGTVLFKDWERWWTRRQATLYQVTKRLDHALYVQEQLEGLAKYVGRTSESEYVTQPIPPHLGILQSPLQQTFATLAFYPRLATRYVDLAGYPSTVGLPVHPGDGLDIFNFSVPSVHVPYIQYKDGSGVSYYKLYTGRTVDDTPHYNSFVPVEAEGTKVNTLHFILWLGGNVTRRQALVATALGIKSLGDGIPKDSFRRGTYQLAGQDGPEPELRIDIPLPLGEVHLPDQEAYLAEVAQYLQAALPNLVLGAPSIGKEKGHFTLWGTGGVTSSPTSAPQLVAEWGITYYEDTWPDLVLNDHVLNSFLYVEENTKPLAQKKRMDVRYASLLTNEGDVVGGLRLLLPRVDISAALIHKTITEEHHEYPVLLPTGESWSLDEMRSVPVTGPERGMPYLQVNVKRAHSRSAILQFGRVLGLLLVYYGKRQGPLLDYYQRLASALGDVPPAIGSSSATSKRPDRTGRVPLSVLEEANRALLARNNYVISTLADRKEFSKRNTKILNTLRPDVFVSGYPRGTCMSHKPMVLHEEELEFWAKRGRVVRYPDAPDGLLLTCPYAENPHIGVKYKELPGGQSNYYPCCYATDTTYSRKHSFQLYLTKQPPATTTSAQNKVKGTDKLLAIYGAALLSRVLKSILDTYRPGANFHRFGVSNHSLNSLLHCALVATQVPAYAALTDLDAREQYTWYARQELLKLPISLCAQELYDLSPEQAREMLADRRVFLDPSLFYRLVEEHYGVNIYTFSMPYRGADVDVRLEVPRAYPYHARTLRLGRPTIVVICHWGGESDALTFPQCDLCVDYNVRERVAKLLFDQPMTRICHGALLYTQRLIQRSPAPAVMLLANVSRTVQYLEEYNYRPLSQYLDSYGKVRRLAFQGPHGPFTVVTTPCQPENLPVSDTIHRAPMWDIVARQVVAVSEDSTQQVSGLWLSNGDYLPTTSYPNPGLPVRDAPLDEQMLASPIARVAKLRRDGLLLLALLRWLVDLSYQRMLVNLRGNDPARIIAPLPPGQVVADFTSRYLVSATTTEQDSALWYDFSLLDRRLPEVSDVDEALQLLAPVVPTLVRERRIVLYTLDPTLTTTTTPVLAQHVALFLQQNWRPPTEVSEGPRYLSNYYQNDAQFCSSPSMVVLIGRRTLEDWLLRQGYEKREEGYKRQHRTKSEVVRQLTIALEVEKEPIPYLWPSEEANTQEWEDDGRTYLSPGSYYYIQNVAGGELARALQVAQHWLTTGLNTGYDTPPPTAGEPVTTYDLYTISPEGRPRWDSYHGLTSGPVTDEVVGDVRLLRYVTQRYAALLPW